MEIVQVFNKIAQIVTKMFYPFPFAKLSSNETTEHLTKYPPISSICFQLSWFGAEPEEDGYIHSFTLHIHMSTTNY